MADRLKLLFVIENSCYGGGEKTFSLLIRNLSKDRFGLLCAAIPSGRFYDEVREHCRFLPLDLTRRFSPGNIGRLRSMMLEHGVDIAHSQGARADFYCALAAAKAGVKSVATVAMPVEGFDVCAARKVVYSALASFAARKNTAAVTVTPGLAEKLRRLYRRVELIPNPVDLAEFSPSNFNAAPVIEKFGLRGRLVLGALGRLEKQKGYACLLAALKIAFEKAPELRARLKCAIGGSGSLGERLKAQAAAEGVADSVVFCGEIGSARDFLGAADIFVMPSLQEGQPLALLEAMAMEKPVLASDIPGISDTASGGEALLVPPVDPAALADGLIRLASDMPAAIAMGRRARKKAELFGLREYVAAHEALYPALVAQGAGRVR